MAKNQTIGELLRDTDALTYVNAIKVTLTSIKKELTTQNEMAEYAQRSVERTHRLMRKADNQYRVLAKLAQNTEPSMADIDVNPGFDEDDDDLRELMEQI